MWHTLVDPGAHLLDEVGPRASWSAQSQIKKRLSYGSWLNFVALKFPEMTACSPWERITPSTLNAWLALMASLVSPYTCFMRLVDLMTIVTGGAPERDWAFMRRAVDRLKRTVSPSRDKTARVRSTAVLVDLGMRLMQEATEMPADPNLLREIRYRDGLMTAVLALRPLRIKNFAGLVLGRTLLDIGGHHRMCFPAEQVKTRKPIEMDWPADLEPALRTYLDVYRPRLLRSRRSTSFWISRVGGVLTARSIFESITRRTRIALRVSVNPHLFRDCAATTVALEDPSHVGISTPLLGHASPMTTERFYDQAGAVGASRAYQAIIAKRRSELRGTVTKKRLSKSRPSVSKPEGSPQLILPLPKPGHRDF
jgi:integrase/recombinase XerD